MNYEDFLHKYLENKTDLLNQIQYIDFLNKYLEILLTNHP